MIFCIIGKTGVGKTTIAKAVSTTLNIPIIVTYTNRPKRPNEKNGVDYHFVDDKYFDDNIDDFIDLRCYKVATGEIWKYGISKKQINKRDDYRAKEYSNLTQDTKDVIELFIELLNDCKKKREGRELNALLVKILRKQDKKINESLVKIGASGGIISYSLLIFVVIGCVIDAFIGFDNLIEKIKKRTANVEQSTQQKA